MSETSGKAGGLAKRERIKAAQPFGRYATRLFLFQNHTSHLFFGDHRQPKPRAHTFLVTRATIIPNHRQTKGPHWKILIVATHKLTTDRFSNTSVSE